MLKEDYRQGTFDDFISEDSGVQSDSISREVSPQVKSQLESWFPNNPTRQEFFQIAYELGEIELDYIGKNLKFIEKFDVRTSSGIVKDSLVHIFVGDSDGGLHDSSVYGFPYERSIGSVILREGVIKISDHEIEEGRRLDREIQEQLDKVLEGDQKYRDLYDSLRYENDENRKTQLNNQIKNLIRNHRKIIKDGYSKEDRELYNRYQQEFIDKRNSEYNSGKSRQSVDDESGLYVSDYVVINSQHKVSVKFTNGEVKVEKAGSTFFPEILKIQDILQIIAMTYYDNEKTEKFALKDRKIGNKPMKKQNGDWEEWKIIESNIEAFELRFNIRLIVGAEGKIISAYPIKKMSGSKS